MPEMHLSLDLHMIFVDLYKKEGQDPKFEYKRLTIYRNYMKLVFNIAWPIEILKT